MGVGYIINPLEEDFTQRVLKLTDNLGAKLYLEASSLPDKVFSDIERTIWKEKLSSKEASGG